MSKNTFSQGYKAGGVFMYNNFKTRMNEVEKNAENLPVRTDLKLNGSYQIQRVI